MQSTTEMTPTETLIENAERQRRLLRRAAWAGVAFVAVSILIVVGHPLYVRWQLRQHGWVLNTSMRGGLPDWVPQWAEPWFAKICTAQLAGKPLHVSDLESLRRFSDLAKVDFDSTDVSAQSLAVLSQFPDLSSVVFLGVQIDATGLRHLATHRKLESIEFLDVYLDDSALEILATFHRLGALDVTDVTDENLRHLSRLHRLTHLGLWKSHVTDDGATWLTDNCPSLETLSIRGGPMTDVGLAEIARLPHLNYLQLVDVPITDDGIRHLMSCSTMTTLVLQKTKVTSAGVTELRKSHPSLNVTIK